MAPKEFEQWNKIHVESRTHYLGTRAGVRILALAQNTPASERMRLVRLHRAEEWEYYDQA